MSVGTIVSLVSTVFIVCSRFRCCLLSVRRTSNGIWVVCGFFISSIALLIASYVVAFAFGDRWHGVYGVPVHDTIFQGSVFLICAFGALGYAALVREKQSRSWLIALFAIGALFLINFAFVTTSRIAARHRAAPAFAARMALVWMERSFGRRYCLRRWQGAQCGLPHPFCAIGWRGPVVELQKYHAADEATSIGEHIAFLKESLPIIASAPIIGHGTGSIAEEFRRITAGKTGVSAMPTVNSHNQTLAVAIQLGLVGAVVLWAMWIAHIALFTGPSALAWLGLVLVAENILSSTVHSHLFDFNDGWLYVFGVGVLGGTILGERDSGSKKTDFG